MPSYHIMIQITPQLPGATIIQGRTTKDRGVFDTVEEAQEAIDTFQALFSRMNHLIVFRTNHGTISQPEFLPGRGETETLVPDAILKQSMVTLMISES